jgi:ribosomal protein S18 acetylase RimI-like enzyme
MTDIHASGNRVEFEPVMGTKAVSSAMLNAVEENFWSMWSQFGRGPECAMHADRGIVWFETPIEVQPYNMVLRCREDEDADGAIARVFSHFHHRAVPFVWLVHPSARPADLESRLERQGFEAVEQMTGMAMDLTNLPASPVVPPGVQIYRVTPLDDLALYMEFVAARWHVPVAARPHLALIADTLQIGAAGSPNRGWIAVKDGMAVAKVLTHDAGNVVGLYGMATRSASRGLGLGRALCMTALADARKRGRRLAVLHSTPMALPLYKRLGFREVGQFSLCAAPGSFYS